ncbi:metallophosphoesterase [Halobacillus sp. BAB-2008]|uniref:metallophosphoesterase family protein n=1 Tax=Halobacillus sp. BAB-2008 TaxID=1246484 RepID=UPI0002A5008A|nr:metallophosphoesterase [Halobacillus sp. BAB-2008]ELK45144.1 phosphoesterase [Halobacillus sp. BAB-2008]
MKIVVTADTHMPKKAKELPERLMKELPSADAVFHLGDFQSLDVYETLKEKSALYGVYGNVDGGEIRELLPEKQVVTLGGVRFGLVHGHGEKKTTERRALESFEEGEVDVVLFGHSHIPYLRYHKKTLLFNPGSATDKRSLPFYSFGILTLFEGGIHAEHIFYS